VVLGVNAKLECASVEGFHDYMLHIGQVVAAAADCLDSCMPYFFKSAPVTS
jgi:hypothetical protein